MPALIGPRIANASCFDYQRKSRFTRNNPTQPRAELILFEVAEYMSFLDHSNLLVCLW
eukprot:m.58707 g.58707  ORF g.58707 m.58707 type:complete len:58 (-) comp9424_c0_seq1:642-815(-)